MVNMRSRVESLVSYTGNRQILKDCKTKSGSSDQQQSRHKQTSGLSSGGRTQRAVVRG